MYVCINLWHMLISNDRVFTFIHIVFTPVLCLHWPQCALGSGPKASSRLPTPTRRQRRRLGVTYFFSFFFLCSVTSEQRRAERYAAAAAAAAAFKPCSQNRLDFYSLINRREAQKWPSAWNPLNGSPHTISRGRFCGNSREKKSWLRFLPPPPPQRHLLWHRAVTLATLLRCRRSCRRRRSRCRRFWLFFVFVSRAVAFERAARASSPVLDTDSDSFSLLWRVRRGGVCLGISFSWGRPQYKLRSKHFEFIIILCKWILLINVPCVKC